MGSYDSGLTIMTTKFWILFLLNNVLTSVDANGNCCPVRVISNMGDLDDVYTLKEELAASPEPVCVDGCVYTRNNASHTGEEYCFKNELNDGSLECQALPEKSSEEIAQENESLRNENIQLENEIKEEQKAEAEATELGDKLNDVDNKIDELTPSSTLSSRMDKRDVPSTCEELVSAIVTMATTTNVTERLIIVREILQSPITRCSDSSQLLNVKARVKAVKTETNELKVKIKLRIKIKSDKIKANKIKITININLQDIIENPRPTQPLRSTTSGAIIQSTTKQFESTTANPTRETSQGTAGVQTTTGILFGSSSTQRTSTNRPIISTSDSPFGEASTTVGTTEQPSQSTSSSVTGGEEPVLINEIDDGEEPVEIVEGGEEPVLIIPGGEEPTTVTPGGEEPVTITPGGEEPVPVTPGGEEPVPVTPGGGEPVPVTPGGEEPVPVTPGGEKPVPVTAGGEEPVPVTPGDEEPVPVTPGDEEPVALKQ